MHVIFECSVCKETIMSENRTSSGYAIDKDDNKVCYECCGKSDRKELLNLKPKEKLTLYFSNGQVTNWPGSLKIDTDRVKESRHNMGGIRVDFWFKLDGMSFHGYQIGHNNQLAHIYKLKS